MKQNILIIQFWQGCQMSNSFSLKVLYAEDHLSFLFDLQHHNVHNIYYVTQPYPI